MPASLMQISLELPQLPGNIGPGSGGPSASSLVSACLLPFSSTAAATVWKRPMIWSAMYLQQPRVCELVVPRSRRHLPRRCGAPVTKTGRVYTISRRPYEICHGRIVAVLEVFRDPVVQCLAHAERCHTIVLC